jgi:hypothetical protein
MGETLTSAATDIKERDYGIPASLRFRYGCTREEKEANS